MEYGIEMILIATTFAITYKYLDNKYKNIQSSLLKSVNELDDKLKKNTINIGVIDMYTEEEIEQLKGNVDSLDIVLKILTYHTVVYTDRLRSETDTNKLLVASGIVNGLQEMLTLFWKLRNISK